MLASCATERRPARELHLTPQTLKQTPFTPLGRCPIGTPTTQIATKIAAHLPISTSATESLVKDCDGACRSLQSTLAGLALTVNALPPLYSMPPLFPMPSVPTAGAHSLEPPAPLPDFVGASGRSRSPVPLSDLLDLQMRGSKVKAAETSELLAEVEREWRELEHEIREVRDERAAAANSRRQAKAVRQSFREWHATAQRYQRAVMATCLAMRRLFDEWHCSAGSLRRLIALALRIVRPRLRRGFHRLLAHHAERRREHRLLSASVAGFRRRMHAEWRTWASAAAARCEAHTTMRLAVLALTRYRRAVGWLTWRATVEAQSIARARLGASLATMRRRARAAAWCEWTHYSLERAGSLEFRLWCALRLWTREKALAWARWAALTAAWVQRVEMVSQCVARMRQEHLTIGWFTWAFKSRELRSSFEAIHDACCALVHNQRRRAFDLWKGRVEERAAAVEHAHAVMSMLSPQGLSPQGRALRTALWRWAAEHASMLALRRFAFRLLDAKLAAAWCVWSGRSAQLQLAATAACQLQFAELGVALRMWIAALEDAHAARQQLAVAVSTMQAAEVTIAFRTWLANVDAARAHLAATVRAWSPDSRATHRAFHAWAHAAQGQRQLLAAAVRLLAASLLKAFNGWMTAVTERQRLWQAVGCHLVNASVRRGLHSWRTFTAERQALMQQAASCRASMMQSSMRASLNTWTSYAEEHAEASRVLAGALSSLQLAGRAMRRAFNSWCIDCSSLQSMHRATAAMRLHDERVAFSIWHEHV